MSMARRSTAQSFGQLAVEAGVMTEEQLMDCWKLRETAERDGKTPPDIETIAKQKGFMSDEQVRLIKKAGDRIKKDEARSQPIRIGGCEILGQLGGGGLGSVYKARQISMGRVVALKVLHKKWMKDEEFKKRFLLEARLAGRLSHQNLIQVYDVGREKESYYFSMEYIDGETIEQMVDRDGPIPVPRALEIIIQILRAITYIARHKIVHRDIKPGNIMLTRGGVAKLADFGFVKSKFDPLLSTEGEVLGTPDYISPEQALGQPDIDFRSDVYSLGATLYHMLSGRPPFGGTSSEVMQKHIKEDPPDPREFVKELPEPVVHLLKKMMEKNPEDRCQSTQEVFEDIELVRMGQDPLGSGAQAGKATILRAFKIEKSRLDRLQDEVNSLQSRLKLARRVLYGSLAASVTLLVALIIALASLSGE
jgi:serine/threonine protein kinase